MSNREKTTECKVATVGGKRRLQYVNHRTKRKLPITVGPKGGLSYKSPSAKSRRYLKSVCKKIKCSKTFWSEAERMKNSARSKKKRTLRRY